MTMIGSGLSLDDKRRKAKGIVCCARLDAAWRVPQARMNCPRPRLRDVRMVSENSSQIFDFKARADRLHTDQLDCLDRIGKSHNVGNSSIALVFSDPNQSPECHVESPSP